MNRDDRQHSDLRKLSPWRLTIIPMSSSSLLLALFSKNIAEDYLVLDVYTNILEKLARLSDECSAARVLAIIRELYAEGNPAWSIFQPIPSGSTLRVSYVSDTFWAGIKFAGSCGYEYPTILTPYEARDCGLDISTLPRVLHFN